MLCEISIDTIRIYYIFTRNILIISNIKYLGEVSVEHAKKHKSGSFKKWNRQRDFINWIKKKFKRI